MEAAPADRQVEEIESLCMNCHADGTTRLLLTRIPFFREIVIMSFSCPECGFSNAEIQSAGEIQQRGVRFVFRVENAQDLQRQVVKSDTAVFKIEDIDLEIPAGRGQMTNVEGLLSMVKQDLELQQPQRKEVDDELFAQIEAIIAKLSAMLDSETFPFTVTLDDSAGNSSFEPSPSDKSQKYTRSEYARSPAQNAQLGLGEASSESQNDENTTDTATSAPDVNIRPEYHATQMYPSLPTSRNDPGLNADTLDGDDIVENQVYTFPSSCPGCTRPCDTNMKMVRIPHFEEVVLMSTVCDHCGYRSNEVKSGGAVPEKGRRITLDVRNNTDLARDILKAESCSLTCPQLSLTVEPGTMGGRFTTVEGLLTQVRDDLRSSVFDTSDGGDDNYGDSMSGSDRGKWGAFFQKLDSAIEGEIEFTLVLEDPMAGSYVQSLTAPEPDPQISVEEYERTEEEEEHLGLRDIKTENYGEDETDEEVETQADTEVNGKLEDLTLKDKTAAHTDQVQE